jgi:hypothetical protein
VPLNTGMSVLGYGWKDHLIEVNIQNNICAISFDGKQIYYGIPKLVRIK